MTIMIGRVGLLLTLACLVLPGCATSGAPSAYSGNLADSDAVRNRQPARKVRAAERMLDAGNPYSAITRLHHTVLTPSEIMRRDREANPLRIFNVTAFPAGRDRRTLAYRRYVVAGQVTNQSSSVLRSAEVHVTLFGFGNVIYDTRTQQFGTLRPGQVRAFSLRFSNFDALNRIERYDTVGSYDR